MLIKITDEGPGTLPVINGTADETTDRQPKNNKSKRSRK